MTTDPGSRNYMYWVIVFSNMSKILNVFHDRLNRYGNITILMLRSQRNSGINIRFRISLKGEKKWDYDLPLEYDTIAIMKAKETFNIARDMAQTIYDSIPQHLKEKLNDGQINSRPD